MDYRKPAQYGSRKDNVSNDSAYISFAPPSVIFNGLPADSPNMWWDEERIEATVTRQFVCSQLRPDEQERLDQPLGFGDGLTDDTYMEWIELKAKRIFLILVDLGVPDQIFGVVDDSWDDDDLPVPLDQVERLQLTYEKDEKLERKFFQRQFVYLLRNIHKGEHLHYDEEEVVPLELAERKGVTQVTGLSQGTVDKVHLPRRPDDVFTRRKVPLGITPGRMPEEDFLSGVQAMKGIEHSHLVSVWASYIQHDCGYLLFHPANDSNLKKFLEVTPPSIKILSKLDRRVLLLNWIHCLADAVAFLHGTGQSHKNIKPSTILIDQDNYIFLGDYGMFSSVGLSGERRTFDKEAYDYAAPENAQLQSSGAPSLVPLISGTGIVRRSTTTSISTTSIDQGTVYRDDSGGSSPTSTWSHTWSTSTSPTRGSPPRNSPPRKQSISKHDPQKADVFALGAVILELLTFFLKKDSRKFAAHRSAKNKTPGRGGGLPDSSFHKNLGQVETWTATLSKEASKKEDQLFRGVERILILTEKMLSSHPEERPSASYVQNRIHSILSEFCAMGFQRPGVDGQTNLPRGAIHCESYQVNEVSLQTDFEELRLASQQAAAQACANVSPFSTEPRAVGVNGGVLYGVERSLTTTSHNPRLSGSSYGNFSLDRFRSQESDTASVSTAKGSSRSGEDLSRSRSGNSAAGGGRSTQGRLQPKARAWKAPIYAELSFA